MANKTKKKSGYIIWTLFHPGFVRDENGDYHREYPYWIPVQNFRLKMPCIKESLIEFLAYHGDIFENLKDNFSTNYSVLDRVYAISLQKKKHEYLLDVKEMQNFKETILARKQEIIKKNKLHSARIAWKWKKIPYKFRYDPVPNIRSWRFRGRKTHGHSGLRSTVSFNTDSDYLDFSDTEYLIKSERIRKWDWDYDGTRRIRRNWKKQYKVRKQWEIHLPRHFDRIDFSRIPDSDEVDDFDLDG